MPANQSPQIFNLKNASELYSYLLWVLNKVTRKINTESVSKQINVVIENIKLCFIDHRPINDALLLKKIENLKGIIPQDIYENLCTVICSAENESMPLTKRWENPFQRAFESIFAIQFATHPTQDMLKAAQLISEKLIIILQNNREHTLIKTFLNSLTVDCKEQESFGKFKPDHISLDDVIKYLQQNSPEEFYRTLFIHFSFARYALRGLENISTQLPIHLLPGVFHDFLMLEYPSIYTNPSNLDNVPEHIRIAFINTKLNGADGFKDKQLTRGRAEFVGDLDSNVMGLMLLHQDRQNLPALDPTQSWRPDAICQKPFYASPYVQKVLNNDLIYIAGPSGMTTLLLGMLELFACMPSQDLKDQYAFSVATYLATGGVHALHEALYVAHDVLNYYPTYTLGSYHDWLEYVNNNDQFNDQLDQVWEKYLDFCDRHFRFAALNNEFKNRYTFFRDKKDGESELVLRNERMGLELK